MAIVHFPELTSFGTLLSFALALEEAAGKLAQAALDREDCASWSDALSTTVKKHAKRHKSLERLRRERLNEVVLQPVKGMAREEYLPPEALGATPAEAAAAVSTAEMVSARFYDDAAAIAVNVLGGLDKTFRRMAKENRTLANGLGATGK